MARGRLPGVINAFTVLFGSSSGITWLPCQSQSPSPCGELVGKALVIGPAWEKDGLNPDVLERLCLFPIFEMRCFGLVLACMVLMEGWSVEWLRIRYCLMDT